MENQEEVIFETDNSQMVLEYFRQLLIAKLQKRQQSLNIEGVDEFTFCHTRGRYDEINDIIKIIKES